jgi:ribosomal protein S9
MWGALFDEKSDLEVGILTRLQRERERKKVGEEGSERHYRFGGGSNRNII